MALICLLRRITEEDDFTRCRRIDFLVAGHTLVSSVLIMPQSFFVLLVLEH
jgi:hypothetical protein